MNIFSKIKSIFSKPKANSEATEKLQEGWEAYFKANELSELRKNEEALLYYDLAIKNNIQAGYGQRGFCLQALNFHYDAIEDFDLAILNTPEDPNLYFGKALSLNGLIKYEEAEEYFRKAIALSAENNELNKIRDDVAKTINWDSANQLYRSHLDMCLQSISLFKDLPHAKERTIAMTEFKRRKNI